MYLSFGGDHRSHDINPSGRSEMQGNSEKNKRAIKRGWRIGTPQGLPSGEASVGQERG